MIYFQDEAAKLSQDHGRTAGARRGETARKMSTSLRQLEGRMLCAGDHP